MAIRSCGVLASGCLRCGPWSRQKKAGASCSIDSGDTDLLSDGLAEPKANVGITFPTNPVRRHTLGQRCREVTSPSDIQNLGLPLQPHARILVCVFALWENSCVNLGIPGGPMGPVTNSAASASARVTLPPGKPLSHCPATAADAFSGRCRDLCTLHHQVPPATLRHLCDTVTLNSRHGCPSGLYDEEGGRGRTRTAGP